jgi:hypothetical protein
VFDNAGLVLDRLRDARPERSHNVVWVGTGENNSQRSLSPGATGSTERIDGGKTWKNMGLKRASTSA